MTDLLTELSQIIQEMDDLNKQASESGLNRILTRLEQAALEVATSWSGSWFGYQANVYYRNFRTPSKEAYFNRDRGTSPPIRYVGPDPYATTGHWVEYDPNKVTTEIHRRAGEPDMGPALTFREEAERRLQWNQKKLLSVIDIGIGHLQSELLLKIREEVNDLKVFNEDEWLKDRAPQPPYQTNDRRAIQQGLVAPPHVRILSWVNSIESALKVPQSLREAARHVEFHLSHRSVGSAASPVGTSVFIGHGRSTAWRELKEFLEERLGLEVDEFNRVPTAGMATTDRLQAMMETSGLAFLVMTAEDEQPDGEFRARENVVHEVGLFQGHLGFKRAIVLLEEGCEEFSNITGLGQIRFPKGNIKAASEDIREVLEREGLLSR